MTYCRIVAVLTAVVSLLTSRDSADDTVERVSITVSKGQAVELTCRKPGSYEPTVAQWKYVNGRSTFTVSLNGWTMPRFRRRFAVKSSNDSANGVLEYSLVISRLTSYDAGVYICVISDRSDEMRRFVGLDVAETAMLRTATVGSDVTLPCNSTSLNPVEWTRCNAASNGTMSTVVKQRRVMTSHDNVTRFSVQNGSDLVISDVTVADAGVYLCTEDDGFGTKYPIVLHVLPDGDDNSDGNQTSPGRRNRTCFHDNGGVFIEVDEDGLTEDGHPHTSRVRGRFRNKELTKSDYYWIPVIFASIAFVVVIVTAARLTCTCHGTRQRPGGSETDSESSMDDLSLLERPRQQQQRRKKGRQRRLRGVSEDYNERRQRLGGVSDDDVAHCYKLEPDCALEAPPPTPDPEIARTQAQAFPGLGVMRHEYVVLPAATPDPVVVEPQRQVSPGTGSNPVEELNSKAIPGPATDPGQYEPDGQAFPGPGFVPAAVKPAAATVVVVHAAVEHQPISSDDS